MKAQDFFANIIIYTLALLLAELIKYVVIKLVHLLPRHTRSKPVEAEDDCNCGMFNELCHCKP